MIEKILYRLSNRLPCRVINQEGERRYLERYYLGKFLGITFYLHRFVGGDGDRALHDHPWEAMSLILSGGYREECLQYLCSENGVISFERLVGAFRINRIRINEFHRIVNIQPNTWTLFMHGNRVKSWGFLSSWDNDMRHVHYCQPLDLSTSIGWHKNAKTGAQLRAAGVIK